MSDLGDRRRQARTRSAEKTSERMSARLALREAFEGRDVEDIDENDHFDMLEVFRSPKPQPTR